MRTASQLWIAFKFVSLYRMTQRLNASLVILDVVNCFQICIFVSDDTAGGEDLRVGERLWIAFKFVSLYRMTQLCRAKRLALVGCELLSNLYLCIGWHSKNYWDSNDIYVVNCFQICIFVSDDTALSRWCSWAESCELLSNLYLCIGWHSDDADAHALVGVVNCFQICIFVSDDTAAVCIAPMAPMLWIAFKFVSLYRMTQRLRGKHGQWTCCELLSNLYLCIGWHS